MVTRLPVITQREEDMLRLVYQYKYLSLPLLTQGLGYAMTSINHVGECAKGLVEKEMLRRFPLPSTARGTRSFIYTLAPGGVKYLKSLGMDDLEGWTHDAVPPSYMHFSHSLATNELLIAATQLHALVPTIAIHKITPDWRLRKAPLRVQGRDGTTLSMIADATIDVRFPIHGKRMQTLLWLEVDKGTEAQKQMKNKIAALYTIATNTTCLRTLGTPAITIVFATTEGEKRRVQIASWIEQQLTAFGRTSDVDLFLTTHFVPGNVDPVAFYTKPAWVVPGTTSRVPLLDWSL